MKAFEPVRFRELANLSTKDVDPEIAAIASGFLEDFWQLLLTPLAGNTQHGMH